MVAGSISLISPSACATRLPTKRIAGSSSSSTTMALYGATAANAGSSGGCGTMNDQMRPRPDVGSHRTAVDRQCGHIGRGGILLTPQEPHTWTRSSPRAQPSQNSFDVGSARSGNSHPVSIAHPSFVKRIDDVGTPSPLVTSDTSASCTCAVDVPRTWRTPSSPRLNPCTYAADMPPPDVFTGRRPSGHSMLPSSVNGPPSPRSQKP